MDISIIRCPDELEAADDEQGPNATTRSRTNEAKVQARRGKTRRMKETVGITRKWWWGGVRHRVDGTGCGACEEDK